MQVKLKWITPEPDLPKLMILGYARHGKDTVAEMLRDDYGYSFVSSSRFVGEKAAWDLWRMCEKEAPDAMNLMTKIGGWRHYENFEQFFEARHMHRMFWYEAISIYNTGDPGRLGRELFAEYPIYVGLRNKNELAALRNTRAFAHSIWVDRSDSVKAEDKTSCTVEPWMADFILDNNGTLEDTRKRLRELMEQGICLFKAVKFPYELREAEAKRVAQGLPHPSHKLFYDRLIQPMTYGERRRVGCTECKKYDADLVAECQPGARRTA